MPISDYDPIFQAAAQEWDIDPLILKAVAQHESGGNPRAVSKAGAVGVMQIMPDTAKTLGVTDRTDPAQSIYGAAKYLSQLSDHFKNPAHALAAYDAGQERVDDHIAGGGPLPAETQAYVPAVAAQYQKLAKASAPATPAPKPAATAPSDVPSDEDFLKRTSAPAGPKPEGDADFLARTGAKPAAPDAPPEPPAPPLEDVLSSPDALAADIPQSQTPNPALARVGDAAVQAYQNTPSVLTPAAQAVVDRTGPLGRWIINPALRAVGGAAAGANALTAGGAQAITETAGALGVPALGRDVNMLAQVAPVAHMGAGVPSLPRGVQEAPPAPRFVQEYYGEGLPGNPLASPGEVALATSTRNPLAAQVPSPAFVPPGASVPLLDRITQLIRADQNVANNRPQFIPPDAVQPANPLSAPAPRTVPSAALASTDAQPPLAAPQSVGAAASREQTPGQFVDMTPKQVQAYRSTAEGQKLLEPQQPGVADPNVYVPGVTPNAAEIEQTVNTSRELKALNISAPEVSQEAKEVAAANNEARQQYFANVAGSDVNVANEKAARQAQAEKDLAFTWANKTAADPQPVLDVAAKIKASPDGRRPIVRNAVDAAIKELYDADGNLIADPEQLYGVRKHFDDLMSREAGVSDPKAVRAFSNLGALKTALDGVINKAAPGFSDYLTNFANASKHIDEMEALQKFEGKLYDSQNRMSYNKVQTMMRNIVDSRQAPGINPYKSITDETMQKLWALRDDLRRSASAQELARTPGSDTTQTMMDTMKGIGKTSANLATHAALISHFGPAANFVYQSAKNLVSVGAEARAARQRTARGMSLLHPDESKLRNPLQNP